MPAYRVPYQPLLFDIGIPVRKLIVPRRQLEKRLDDLRLLKLELEESNERKRQTIKDMAVRLEEVNSVLYRKSDVHKQLYITQQKNQKARRRMKELGSRIEQVQNDYTKLERVVEKFRPDMQCAKCKQTKKIECFAKDVTKLLGRESRCRICLREKTQRWRRAKKLFTPA